MAVNPALLAGTAAAALVALGVGLWLGQNPAPPVDAIAVPSGQIVTLIEVIANEPGPAGLTSRFRFLATEIAGLDQDMAQQDLAALCQSYALPRIPTTGPQPAQIVISLSDRVLPFGDAAPEATQLFGAFSRQDGACVEELF